MSDSEKLRAPGITVRLKDGKEHQLIFDFESYALLEEELGDLAIFIDRTKLEDQYKPYRIRNVILGMQAGLLHETEPPFRPNKTQIARLLVLKETPFYITKMLQAFTQGMADIDEDEETSPKEAGSRDNSLGNASTTLPPSDSVAATASSGA